MAESAATVKIQAKKNSLLGNSTAPDKSSQQQGAQVLLTPQCIKLQLTNSFQPVETIAGIQRESSWSSVAERLQQANHHAGPSGRKQQHSSSSTALTLKKIAQFERLLPILDVHKYSRASLFKKIYEELHTMLLNKLSSTSMDKKKADSILDDAFREQDNPLVSKILLHMLESCVDSLKARHLEHVVRNPSLYQQCSLAVKKKTWLFSSQLFFKEITVLLNDAISKDQEFYRQLTIQNPFSRACQLLPNLDSICKTLATYVAHHDELYDLTTEMILNSYEQSGQDSIYSLMLFSLNYSLVRDLPDDSALPQSISLQILKLLSLPAMKDQTGALTEECLTQLVSIIDNVDAEDFNAKKLLFMTLSSPLFMHMLGITLSKIYAQLSDQTQLPKSSKELQMAHYVLQFGCQELNLDDSETWCIDQPSGMNTQFVNKYLPVLMNYLTCITRNIDTTPIKVSQEVKNLSKMDNAASFLAFHIFSTSLKKIVGQKPAAASGQSQTRLLAAFVRDFEEALLNIAPQHCLELMLIGHNLVRLDKTTNNNGTTEQDDLMQLFQSLFLPWLKSANYPANFIMVKLMSHFKSRLNQKQWRFVGEIATELDHEEFCRDHGTDF